MAVTEKRGERRTCIGLVSGAIDRLPPPAPYTRRREYNAYVQPCGQPKCKPGFHLRQTQLIRPEIPTPTSIPYRREQETFFSFMSLHVFPMRRESKHMPAVSVCPVCVSVRGRAQKVPCTHRLARLHSLPADLGQRRRRLPTDLGYLPSARNIWVDNEEKRKESNNFTFCPKLPV